MLELFSSFSLFYDPNSLLLIMNKNAIFCRVAPGLWESFQWIFQHIILIMAPHMQGGGLLYRLMPQPPQDPDH